MSLLAPHPSRVPRAAKAATQEPVAGAPAPAPGEPLLRLSGLNKRFGPVRVLKEIDLSVRQGELLALIGENGAGKSTIVKCIAGVMAPDSGAILLRGEPLGAGLNNLQAARVAVVWQDLALCDNLDTVANLFLGRERGRLVLSDSSMHAEAKKLLDQLGIAIDDVRRPVGLLSGGQRQSIALARAMLADPQLLILDEPTASLGVTETQSVLRLVAQLRARGTTILLVSHDLDQVFELADRIAVLRQGHIAATFLPREVHPDDVVAVMSGAEVDTTARKQLQRLRSLVDQLSEAEPSASLPLIVSAMAAAIGQDSLCVHLVEEDTNPPSLRMVAAVGLPTALLQINQRLPVGADGGPAGLAASSHEVVVVEDTRTDAHLAVTTSSGVLSAWAAPIIGTGGVIGTVSGYGEAVGRPADDQLELVSLYASHAAAAIERDRLLHEATRRNRVLETLRDILEILAGPDPMHGGLKVAVLSLCRGLGADAVALHDEAETGQTETRLALTSEGGKVPPHVLAELQTAAEALLRATDKNGPAHNGTQPTPGDTKHSPDPTVHPATLASVLEMPGGRAVLSARWPKADRVSADAANLFWDAARSLQLAVERDSLLDAQQQAAALRRSNVMQRQFLSRLSHDLRTPLTAVQGYVSTLRQSDVTWDTHSQMRFLDRIGTESARMVRLVGDLLDSSAIEAGILRINPDWCDLPLILEAAVSCLPLETSQQVALRCAPTLGPIWADHDRLEQLFLNLVENAIRHTPPGTNVIVTAQPIRETDEVVIRVTDNGPGIPPDVAQRMFQPHERGSTPAPGAGLGLTIAKGIVDAHRGQLIYKADKPDNVKPDNVKPDEAHKPDEPDNTDDTDNTGACFEVILPIDPHASGQVP
jgi:signal transduction histidine kinase/ABC-type multidrug transport system ATPase subunit